MKEIKDVVYGRYLSLKTHQNPSTQLSKDYFRRNGFGEYKNTVLTVPSDEFSNQTAIRKATS
jgi:hypothetical protein